MSNATSNVGQPLGNVSPAQDQEVVFYEGSPKLRGETGLITKCFIAALIIACVPVIIYFVAKDSGIFGISVAVAAVLAIGVFCLPLILVRKNRYRITNYRIDHETGLLSKRIDTIELWHVSDVRMEQSFFDRILGVGTIEIYSSDNTEPTLPLRSLPEPRKLLDTVKQRIIAVKRQRGVVKFDGGAPGHGADMDDLAGDHHHHH